jgi:predicted AlkP superfamily phosphohydrolase/phosphomutase
MPFALVFVFLSCSGARSPERSHRVFLIGIDGATWQVMDPLLAAGRLPNLRSLIDSGVRAPLGSMLPSRSPALWTTVATGKSFEKHGINDFTSIIREDGTESSRVMHMTSNMRKTKALWNIVGAAPHGAAFVGWWVSWPADSIDGLIVTSHVPLEQTGGKDAPTKGTLSAEDIGGQTWPPELFEELRPLIRPAESVTWEEARRFMDIEAGEMDRDIVEGFRWAFAADETYRAVTKHLLEKAPSHDLWGIYYNGIDVVEHRFWRYVDPTGYRAYPPEERPRFAPVIDRYYEYTDELIGDILASRLPGDTFIVLSDHGFHTGGHEDGPGGVLIASGENIAKGAGIERAELADITPTVLALLGLPAAEDMDGRVLEEIFVPSWRARYPKERIETYDTEEWQEQKPLPSSVDEELRRRLEALGYL